MRAARRRTEADEKARAAARLDTSRTSFPEKDQLGTSCSISENEPENEPVFADDLRVHAWRHAIAEQLLLLEWPQRAEAYRSCGEAGARCDCGTCGAAHVLPYRCGGRGCPTCARIASAIVSKKVSLRSRRAFQRLEIVQQWEGRPIDYKRRSAANPRKPQRTRRKRKTDLHKPRAKSWRLLTLTTLTPGTTIEQRYAVNPLTRRCRTTRRCVGKFWRATPWGQRVHDISPTTGKPTKRARRDTIYILGIEVSPGGTLLPDGTLSLGGMVHVHMAVYGEYVADWYLQQLWREHCPIAGYISVESIQASTAQDFEKAMREVLKYVTKGDKQPGDRAARAAAVEVAMKGVRRIEVGGAIRLEPQVTDAEIATEGQQCGACGEAESWRWRGMRAPEYVRQNGGFGVSHIVDDDDAAIVRKHHNQRAATRDYIAREKWAKGERERRPGGQFYGGEPPPWMDDGDEWDEIIQGHVPITHRTE